MFPSCIVPEPWDQGHENGNAYYRVSTKVVDRGSVSKLSGRSSACFAERSHPGNSFDRRTIGFNASCKGPATDEAGQRLPQPAGRPNDGTNYGRKTGGHTVRMNDTGIGPDSELESAGQKKPAKPKSKKSDTKRERPMTNSAKPAKKNSLPIK